MAGLRKSVELSGEHFVTLVVYPFSTSLSVIRRSDRQSCVNDNAAFKDCTYSLLEDRDV